MTPVDPHDHGVLGAHRLRRVQGARGVRQGPAVERLGTRRDVLSAAEDDIYVRSALPLTADVTAWRSGSGVAWFSRSRRRAGAGWLTVVADPQVVPALIDAGVSDLPGAVTGATVPAAALPLLPTPVRPVEFDLWDWFSTTTPPPVQPGEDAVRWAEPGDNSAIEALLDSDSPRHSARPGEPEVRRWCLVREAAPGATGGREAASPQPNRLLVCAAHIEYVPAVPHLASIVTRSDHRGRGLGAAASAWLTRRILAEGAPLVTLGMYADNDVARRLYHRLGFTDSHHWASGRFPGTRSASGVKPSS